MRMSQRRNLEMGRALKREDGLLLRSLCALSAYWRGTDGRGGDVRFERKRRGTRRG